MNRLPTELLAEPSAGDGWQAVRRSAAAVPAGELVSLWGAMGLVVSALAFRWFGIVGAGGLERAGPTRAVGLWPAMSVARWLVVATVAVALGGALGRLARRGDGMRTAIARSTALLGGTTALVLAYRILISPPHADRILDVKLGAPLGLACTLAVALGGLASWREAQAELRLATYARPHATGHRSRLSPAR